MPASLQIERTRVCKNTLNPVWNERLWLLVQVRSTGGLALVRPTHFAVQHRALSFVRVGKLRYAFVSAGANHAVAVRRVL